MLVPVIASGLVSVLLVASGVHAANSRVTCSKHLGFAANKEGLDPCAAWAEMRNVCDSSSSSDVTSLTTGYSSYPAPSSSSNTHDCDCNYEAYNNMAACMLCQGRENWVSLNTWRAGCADFDIGFLYGDAYKIDASEVTDISINMPASVRIYRPTGTWDPEAACRISFSDWDECDSLFGATSTGKGGGSNARPTGRPSSSSIYDELEANTTVLWIVVAVCVALPALLSLIALIVCCVRQKNRKKFYGPLAAYYRSGGAPPPSAFNQGGLLANHYQSQSAVLHSQHSQYTSVSTDAPKYDAGSFGSQPYDPPKAFAGQAYDPPQQQFPGQQYQQYQYGDPYKA